MKIITTLVCLGILLYSCSPHVYQAAQPAPAVQYTQAPPPQPAPTAPPPINFQTFYDELSPYGTWIQSPNYGYVWSPNTGPGFTPYSSEGNWQYSADYGWIWASDYSWGWAPFHYGRWFYDEMYGWMWVPGYQWAPAWVVWGSYQNYSGNYYGWAPMGPGVNYSSGGYYPPSNSWTFVPASHVYDQNVYSYRAQNITVVNNNVTIINNSNTYNNQTYYAGPRAVDVAQATGRQVTPVVVREATNPGATTMQNKQLSIYRPAVNTTPATKPAPAKIVTRETLKPVIAQPANPSNSNPQKPEVKPAPPQKPEVKPVPAQPATPVQKEVLHEQPANNQIKTTPSQPATPIQNNVHPSTQQQPVQVQPNKIQPQPVNGRPVKKPAAKPVKPVPKPQPPPQPVKEPQH